MSNFTPQQIEEFLQEFFDVVGARQYVGARYVPIFGRAGEDTIEWDDLAPYEPLTVVMHEGVSYVSRRYVPAGIQITDTSYWVQTYRFNAQVEQYRQEVLGFQDQIDTIRETMESDYVPFPDPTHYPKLGVLGQVLSTLADGTTKWENPVVPSDAQAEEVITAWLNEHPEATTTVQDGAITFAKMAESNVFRLPYCYNEAAINSYTSIHSIPFSCIGTVGASTHFDDLPSGYTSGAAFAHLFYQSGLSYALDMFFPYSGDVNNAYWRICHTNGTIAVPWKQLRDYNQIKNYVDNSITSYMDKLLVPYSYNEEALRSYGNIYEVPFSCVSVIGNSVNFSDLPSGISTGCAFAHLKYQGATNGYAIDIIFPYGFSQLDSIYYRISGSTGPYFAWQRLPSSGSRTKYVAFGDSITRGYRGSQGGVATIPYPQAVARKNGLYVTNEGVDGTGWDTDFNQTGSTGYAKVMGYDLTGVDLVTIAFGINDYINQATNLTTIETRIRAAIEHISSTYPMTTLIIITPIFYGGVGNASTDYATNYTGPAGFTLKQYTDLLVSLGEEYKVAVINQLKTGPVNAQNFSQLLSDNLHPNENGYLKYGCMIAAEVGACYHG